MSINTECYFSLENTQVQVADLARILNREVPAVSAVENYWTRRHQSGQKKSTTDRWYDAWKEDWTTEPDVCLLMHEGELYVRAGSLRLYIYPQVALLSTNARWRGFLTIEELRVPHRTVASELAQVFNSAQIVWASESGFEVADFDPVDSSIDNIIEAMSNTFGPAEESIDTITVRVMDETKTSSPKVWYVEDRKQ